MKIHDNFSVGFISLVINNLYQISNANNPRNLLNWNPKTELKEGLKKLVLNHELK